MNNLHLKMIALAILITATGGGSHSAAAEVNGILEAKSTSTTLCQQFASLWPLADFPEQDRPKVFGKMQYLFCDVYYSATERDTCLSGLSQCPKPETDKVGEKISRK